MFARSYGWTKIHKKARIQAGRLLCLLLWTLVFAACFSRPSSAAGSPFGASISRTKLLVKEEVSIRVKQNPYVIYTFSSSNPKVAQISGTGVIKAKKKGSTRITVNGTYNKNGKTSAWRGQVTITVFRCKMNKKSLSLKQGDTAKLKVKGSTLGRKVTWSSSDKAAVSVSKKGKVTAKQDGKVTVYAHIGKYHVVKCRITVSSKQLPSQSVKLLANSRHIYGAINLANEVRRSKKVKNQKITYRITDKTAGHMSGDIYYADRHGPNVVTAYVGKYKKVFSITQLAWCAHRGYLDIRPENTIDAFEMAGMYGAAYVETDLRLTADGRIVCCHDSTLSHMTGEPASTTKIKNLPYWENMDENGTIVPGVRNYMINNGNGLALCQHRYVPLLEDFLEICRRYGMCPVLELKNIGSTREQMEKTSREIVRLLRLYGLENKALVIANSTLSNGELDHAKMLVCFRETVGSTIPIAAVGAEAWKLIKKLPNAYKDLAYTPVGRYTVKDYNPILGKKGKASDQY